MSSDLVAAFRLVRPNVPATPELARLLAGRLAEATETWPGLAIAPARFARALAERAAVDAPIGEAIAALASNDLYLACGCADGDPAALAHFELQYGRVIDRAIAAAGAPTAERADLGQVVRSRILVGAAERSPRIANFQARGSLAGWSRVIAAREVTRFRSRRVPPTGDPNDDLAHLIASGDPELDYMKLHYRVELKQALERAIDELPHRDLMILRQHAVDRLGIDQLAALHRVHRATAARWIASAREAVVHGTRGAFAASLHLSPRELDSIMRMIRSELDVSLSRLLRGANRG